MKVSDLMLSAIIRDLEATHFMNNKGEIISALTELQQLREEAVFMKPNDNPCHITVRNEPNGFLLKCHCCETEYRPDMPCEAGVFVAILKAFNEAHRDCAGGNK